MTITWKRCSFCKKDIVHGAVHYVCSVSTCNHKRTGLVFCSVGCWTGHDENARHRDAWAVEETAPHEAEAEEEAKAEAKAVTAPLGALDFSRPTPATDVLVVASKVKQYIKERSEFNTSAATMDALTQCVIQICDEGIRRAEADGRKTVMDRDIPKVSFSSAR